MSAKKTAEQETIDYINVVNRLNSVDDDIKDVKSSIARMEISLAEHASSTKAVQSALVAEVNELRKDHLTKTGNQGSAIEKIKVEREAGDRELRTKLDFYEKRETAIWNRFEKLFDELDDTLKEMNERSRKGEQAYNVLLWMGGVLGGAMLVSLAVFLMSGKLQSRHVEDEVTQPTVVTTPVPNGSTPKGR